MNLRNTTQTSQSPKVTAAELLAALDKKAAGLRERDKALLAEQIRLERAGASPAPGKPIPEAQQMAREILNGYAGLLPEIEPSGRLHQILVERTAVSIAVATLGREEMRARAVALAQMIEEKGDVHREIVRARVDALLALRRANARAEAFRSELAGLSGGYGSGLLCDPYAGALFEPPVVGDDGYLFLESCVANGFATKREITSPC
jgi:hypothetical protein